MTIEVERDGDRVGGRIVEVEAYAGADDLASHAVTLRAGMAALSGDVGHLYMYRSYGIHTMLNIVAHAPQSTGAVLVRALEPIVGLETMQRRRDTDRPALLTSGPGKLCQALDLRLADLGRDLMEKGDIMLSSGRRPGRILCGPRVGISRSTERPWRMFDADSVHVSAHRRGGPVESIADYLDRLD